MSEQVSEREIRAAFPPIASHPRYRSVEALPSGAPIVQGDMLRIVLYNEPTWLDALNDPPQDNAEEHIEEVTKLLTDQGLAVLLHSAEGASLGERNGVAREAYAYHFEVLGFQPPSGDTVEIGAGTMFTARNAALLIGVLLAGSALVATVTVAAYGPEQVIKPVSNGIFWLSLAAIAVSIAVVVKSARSAAP